MPGYQTKQEHIAIAGVDALHIRSLLDRQQFSDPLGEAEALGISAAAWPLFGLLWPSGAQLAERIGRRAVVPGERILEMGCGLALASLVAHRRGADITASDCHPLADAFLRENLRLNHLAPLKYRHGPWAMPLALGPGLAAPAEACSIPGGYQLLIGSDLLYERDDKALLARFIERHAGPSAEVWIVDPDRSNRSAFNRRMADQGFERSEERLDRPASALQSAYKGRLLTYRREAQA